MSLITVDVETDNPSRFAANVTSPAVRLTSVPEDEVMPSFKSTAPADPIIRHSAMKIKNNFFIVFMLPPPQHCNT